jgi:hypothetical protein
MANGASLGGTGTGHHADPWGRGAVPYVAWNNAGNDTMSH